MNILLSICLSLFGPICVIATTKHSEEWQGCVKEDLRTCASIDSCQPLLIISPQDEQCSLSLDCGFISPGTHWITTDFYVGNFFLTPLHSMSSVGLTAGEYFPGGQGGLESPQAQ